MNRYANFDLELLDYVRQGRAESVRAWVSSSGVGQSDADAAPVEFPEGLRGRIRRLEARDLSFDELVTLGEELASLLLPPPVRALYRRCLDALEPDQGLRIRIRPHHPALAELPWEYVYAGRPDIPPGRKGTEGFLALDAKVSLVRYEVMDEAAAPITPMEHRDIRAVALLAEVEDPAFPPLDFDREELNLRQALEGVGGIDARFLRPGTRRQFDEMLDEGAQVLHFSGHGKLQLEQGDAPRTVEGAGQLVLAGETREPDLMDVGTLAVRLRGKGVRLVVLGACEAARRDAQTPWSGIAPALARQGIPAVVGMQYTVRDSSAIAFSHRFYKTLAAGGTIDSAVAEGRQAVLQRGGGEERDWGVPVLYMRSEQSILFPPPLKPLRHALGLATATFFLLAIWFYLHILPAFLQRAESVATMLGVPLAALVGLWGLVQAWRTIWSKSVGSEREAWWNRLLRHRWARPILGGACAAAALLFVSTSSLYLEFAGEKDQTVELEVKTAAGSRFDTLPSLEVSAGEGRRRSGGPIFGFPPPGSLKLSVARPAAGWSLKETLVSPRPFWRKVISVPGDFDIQEFRILRLVPDNTLSNIFNAPFEYEIVVTMEVDGAEDFQAAIPYDGGMVWIGGAREDLQRYAAEEAAADQRASLQACTSAGELDEKIRKWTSNQRYIPTPVIGANDTISIEVKRSSDGRSYSKLSGMQGSQFKPGALTTECLPKT